MIGYDPAVSDALKSMVIKDWTEGDVIRVFDADNDGAEFKGRYMPCDTPGLIQVGFIQVHVAQWDFQKIEGKESA